MTESTPYKIDRRLTELAGKFLDGTATQEDKRERELLVWKRSEGLVNLPPVSSLNKK